MLDRNAVFSPGKEPRPFYRICTPAVRANLAVSYQRLEQIDHRRDFLERIIPDVQLIQIDHIRVQATETGLALLADV